MEFHEYQKILDDAGFEVSREAWYDALGHVPRRGQAALDNAVDVLGKQYVCLFAFPRAGKSFGAARHVGPELLKFDNHGWIVAPKYEFGEKEFGYIWSDLIETGLLRLATRKYFDTRGGNMYVEFPWGSFVKVVSADNPTSLRAEELDWVILAEASAIPQNVYDQNLFMRVKKRRGKVLVPTTPKGKNWIYDRFRIPSLQIDRAGNPNPLYNPNIWSCVLTADPKLLDPLDPDLADLYEPGIYTDEDIEEAERQLPRPLYVEQVGGGFASYAGAILPYNPDTMRVDPFVIPPEWTHIVGWDHGASPDPTAIMVGSYSPDGTLYWWGEVRSDGDTTSNHLSALQTLLSWDGQKRPLSLVAVDTSAKQVRIELAAHGISTDVPHTRQILDGIIRMTSLMREGKWKIFKGRCLNWEYEAIRWEWDEKNPQKPAKNQQDHFLDGSRYASLITVPLPLFPEAPAHASARPVLDAQKSRLWSEFQKRLVEEQEARESDEQILLVEDDPFAEDGPIFVDDYQLD